MGKNKKPHYENCFLFLPILRKSIVTPVVDIFLFFFLFSNLASVYLKWHVNPSSDGSSQAVIVSIIDTPDPVINIDSRQFRSYQERAEGTFAPEQMVRAVGEPLNIAPSSAAKNRTLPPANINMARNLACQAPFSSRPPPSLSQLA